MEDLQSVQPNVLISQALRSCQEGHYSEAEWLCLTVVDRCPTHAEALHMLGVIAYTQGRLEEGCRRMEESFRHNPSPLASHLFNYAVLMAAMERHVEAVTVFEKVLSLVPALVSAYGRLGYSLLKSGRPQEALCWCERGVAHLPGYAEGHYFLGEALLASGRQEEAIASFRQALLLRPGSSSIRILLGNAFNRQGLSAEAVACCRLNLPTHATTDNSFRSESNSILRTLCETLPGHVLSIGSGSDADKEGRLCREYFTGCASYFRLDNDMKYFPDIVGDVQNLRAGIADHAYDVALSLWALEHVPDGCAALAEIHRIVRPGGYFVFGLPLNSSFHSFPHDYHRFTLPGIREIFHGRFHLDKVYSVGEELPFVLDEGLAIVGQMTETAPAGYIGLARVI